MIKTLLIATVLVAAPSFAQTPDPLRNVSGTTANAGEQRPWVVSDSGGWAFFYGLTAHVTHVNESGPAEPRNEVFSTNWFAAGLHRDLGENGFVLFRGRVSLEPFTIPDNDGYPQILQYIPPEAGGPLIDRMRPHDLLGEAAVHAGWRPSSTTLVHVYAAAVGDPAFGPAPFALRSSGADLPEAPFAYELQETTHDSTKVVTAGFDTAWFKLEASVFHDAVTFGDHTDFDSGDIDSNAIRLTVTPTPSLHFQVSRADLGDEGQEREVTSASVSYGTPHVAVTALWTRREQQLGLTEQTGYGFEIALRSERNTLTGRAEWVDRPRGFPLSTTATTPEQTTHVALGYIFDFVRGERLRAGAGVAADYHLRTHDLEHRYGHKPQAIFAFVRLRSGRM